MDSFTELIVQKKKEPKEWLIIVAVLVAALVVSAAAFLFLPTIFVFVLAGCAYGAWWVASAQNKEYEYCVTNGDIDIDMIIARRKRRRLVSVAGRKVESLLPYDSSKPQGVYQRIVVAAPSLDAAGLWSFTYHSKKNGHTLVVFQPNERVLQALYGGLQKLVRMDTDRATREMGISLSVRRLAEDE